MPGRVAYVAALTWRATRQLSGTLVTWSREVSQRASNPTPTPPRPRPRAHAHTRARASWSESKQGLSASISLSWQAARWGARGAADTLAVRHTRQRRGDALGRVLTSWLRRTCPAAPSVVGWAVLHSAAQRCASLFEPCLRLLRALGTLEQPSAPLSTLVITPHTLYASAGGARTAVCYARPRSLTSRCCSASVAAPRAACSTLGAPRRTSDASTARTRRARRRTGGRRASRAVLAAGWRAPRRSRWRDATLCAARAARCCGSWRAGAHAPPRAAHPARSWPRWNRSRRR